MGMLRGRVTSCAHALVARHRDLSLRRPAPRQQADRRVTDRRRRCATAQRTGTEASRCRRRRCRRSPRSGRRDRQADVGDRVRRPRHRRAARRRGRRRRQRLRRRLLRRRDRFRRPIGKKPSAGGSDAFVVEARRRRQARVGADVRRASATTPRTPSRCTATRIVVVGNFLDEIKLGEFDKQGRSAPTTCSSPRSTRTGEPQWLWTLGGIDSDGANAVAATPDGGWVIGGSFTDTITIGTTDAQVEGRAPTRC